MSHMDQEHLHTFTLIKNVRIYEYTLMNVQIWTRPHIPNQINNAMCRIRFSSQELKVHVVL